MTTKEYLDRIQRLTEILSSHTPDESPTLTSPHAEEWRQRIIELSSVIGLNMVPKAEKPRYEINQGVESFILAVEREVSERVRGDIANRIRQLADEIAAEDDE